MLILSCQREILPMLSIGQTEEHYATIALFALFALSGLAKEISIQLNKLS